MMTDLTIERLDLSLPMPEYKHEGDAGFDLYATEEKTVWCGDVTAVPTGIRCSIPNGYELQVRPRSSMGNSGVFIANSPGTVDAGYRGEILVLLYTQQGAATIRKGDRIAQAVLAPVTRANIIEGSVYTDTDRGEGGFGSTGK